MKVQFFLIAIIIAILATFTFAQDDGEEKPLLMYTSTITPPEGIDNSDLEKAAATLSSFLTTRCATAKASGYASRDGKVVIALWLSNAGERCAKTDFESEFLLSGIYNAIATTPVLAEGYKEKDCTTFIETTQYTYISCSDCPVTGCNSAMVIAITPLLAIVALFALFF